MFKKSTYTHVQTCTCLHDGLQRTQSEQQTHQDTCQVANQRGTEEERRAGQKIQNYIVLQNYNQHNSL